MRVATQINNFSRGKIDHDLNGRSELPLYHTGADVFRNFYSNFKGNAIYRNGFELMLKFQDCAFMFFKFNAEQAYLVLMYEEKMKFLTYDSSGNFGFVQSGGSDLIVSTPYSLAESKEIAKNNNGYDQTGDICYIVHPNHAPRKLVRTSATSFTLDTFVRTADPFTGADKYPSCVKLYQEAAYYANTNDERTTIWRSKIGDYDDMTTGTGDDDGFKVTVAGLTEDINWLSEGANSLIAGSTQGVIPINGGSPSTAITPSNVITNISDADGANETLPIQKENLMFYINSQQRNLNFFRYDIIQETFIANNANLASYDITKGRIEQLVYKKDRNNLIWAVREDKDLVSLNFQRDENITGWHDHKSVADIQQISQMVNNEGDVQLFALLKYGSEYYICRMGEPIELPLFNEFYTGDEEADRKAYHFYIAEQLKHYCYLDLGQKVENYYTTTITYVGDTEVGSSGTITSTGTEFTADDVGNRIYYKTETGREFGIFKITAFTATDEVEVEVLAEPTTSEYSMWYKSFNTISGLADFIGEELSVVGDGGYLEEFTVEEVNQDGVISLGKEVTVAWVGYKYDGLIKTFGLGFSLGNGVNTQITPKNLYRSHIRFAQSAGGKIGTSEYRMTPIQKFIPSGYFDMPPLPIDGTSDPVLYNDSSEKDKYLYIKQDKPLPFHITGIYSEIKYGANL